MILMIYDRTYYVIYLMLGIIKPLIMIVEYY